MADSLGQNNTLRRPSVTEAFTWRRERPDYMRAQVVARPTLADYIDGHRAWLFEDVPWPRSQRTIPPDDWRANHYASMFVTREWAELGSRVRDVSMTRIGLRK